MKYYLMESYRCNLRKFLFITFLLSSVIISLFKLNLDKHNRNTKMVLDYFDGK